MDISQWLGFIILLIAMVFSVIKKIWETFDSRRNPEKYRRAQEEQERLLRELLGIGEDEPKPPSPPSRLHPSPKERLRATSSNRKEDKFAFHSNLEGFDSHSRVEAQKLNVSIGDSYGRHLVSKRFHQGEVAKVAHRSSKGVKLIRRTKSLRQAILLKEILAPPKALDDEQRWG